MLTTVEDAVEILGGVIPRQVNIRVDTNERNLLQSLAKQVHKGIPLTDRQLNLSLNKIDKYREGLEKNSVDVDEILTNKPLRMPLREIDRTQSVYFEKSAQGTKPRIVVKYVFSKKFAAEWGNLEENLIGVTSETKGFKHISYNEKNIFHLVSTLAPMDFIIDQEIREIYEKVVKIMENPEKFAPYIGLQKGKVVIENANSTCNEFLSEKFFTVNDSNFLKFVALAKNCGISLKSPEIIKKIQDAPSEKLTKNVLLENATKFRINPENYSVSDVLTTIDSLGQWPVLFVLDENSQIFSQVKALIATLSGFTELDKVTVFFRLKNEQPENQQFNQFIKDNGLNNYIDSTTKAVFITKNRIPKPLLKADWSPQSAIAFSSNDFGKLSAHLNDIANVYYYNDSVTMRHSRIKGSTQIAQL